MRSPPRRGRSCRLLPTSASGCCGSEAGLLFDKLLSRCARGRGALDVAIGEGLAAMAVGDRVVRLGFSGIGDSSIQELGIARRTAQKRAQLARGLREHPELRAMVWTGDITPRKAEILLRSARADEEWLARARKPRGRGGGRGAL